MKNSVFSILLTLVLAITFSFSLTSCGGNKTEETQQKLQYACPMHPEVMGKEGDVCDKCGMALEKVEIPAEGHESH